MTFKRRPTFTRDVTVLYIACLICGGVVYCDVLSEDTQYRVLLLIAMTAKTPSGTAHASPSETVKKDEGSSAYRLEYFRSAREELNLHFKQRENWLQRQLLSQVVFLALSQGIAIAGIQKANPYPDVLALSTAISLVLASLYYVEDSAIRLVSIYALLLILFSLSAFISIVQAFLVVYPRDSPVSKRLYK